MTTYIALLRAVNLPGHNAVTMVKLRSMMEELGFEGVRTLLQSGNAVFRSDMSKAQAVEQLLETESRERLSLDTEYFVRSGGEWKALIASNPFPAEAKLDPARLHAHCLKEPPGKEGVRALRNAITGREVLEVRGRTAYIVYPDGAGRSRLTSSLIERHLGTSGTGRNWNTVLKLASAAKAVAAAVLFVALLAAGPAAKAAMQDSAVVTVPDYPPLPVSHFESGALRDSLVALVRGFRGTAGIYVEHLVTGVSAGINEDTLFPTASMIKVPILIGTFDAMEKGRFKFLDTMTYVDSLLYPGEDIVGSFRDSARIMIARLALLMITTSDNTASLWLQHLAGTGTAINAWLDTHGFGATRVNSRTPGRQDDRARFGWGQTTPREMSRLLVTIRRGEAVSPAASEEMYRHLTRSYYTGVALAPLPPWVQAASKCGMVDRSRSEAALVNAPSGDYVFCVVTKDQEDQSWEAGNEGWELIRKVSAFLWRYFEPGHPWQPAKGAEKYKPAE